MLPFSLPSQADKLAEELAKPEPDLGKEDIQVFKGSLQASLDAAMSGWQSMKPQAKS